MMHFKYLGFILKYLEILIDPVFREELVEKGVIGISSKTKLKH